MRLLRKFASSLQKRHRWIAVRVFQCMKQVWTKAGKSDSNIAGTGQVMLSCHSIPRASLWLQQGMNQVNIVECGLTVAYFKSKPRMLRLYSKKRGIAKNTPLYIAQPEASKLTITLCMVGCVPE